MSECSGYQSGSYLFLYVLIWNKFVFIPTRRCLEQFFFRVILTTSFTVKDTQAVTSVSVEKNSVSASTVEEALQKVITVTYGDKTYGKDGNAKNDDIIITKVTGTRNVQGAFDTTGNDKKKPASLSKGEYFTETKATVEVEVAPDVFVVTEVSVPGAIIIQ